MGSKQTAVPPSRSRDIVYALICVLGRKEETKNLAQLVRAMSLIRSMVHSAVHIRLLFAQTPLSGGDAEVVGPRGRRAGSRAPSIKIAADGRSAFHDKNGSSWVSAEPSLPTDIASTWRVRLTKINNNGCNQIGILPQKVIQQRQKRTNGGDISYGNCYCTTTPPPLPPQ